MCYFFEIVEIFEIIDNIGDLDNLEKPDKKDFLNPEPCQLFFYVSEQTARTMVSEEGMQAASRFLAEGMGRSGEARRRTGFSR